MRLGHLGEGASCFPRPIWTLHRTGGSSPEAGLSPVFQEPVPPALPLQARGGVQLQTPVSTAACVTLGTRRSPGLLSLSPRAVSKCLCSL